MLVWPMYSHYVSWSRVTLLLTPHTECHNFYKQLEFVDWLSNICIFNCSHQRLQFQLQTTAISIRCRKIFLFVLIHLRRLRHLLCCSFSSVGGSTPLSKSFKLVYKFSRWWLPGEMSLQSGDSSCRKMWSGGSLSGRPPLILCLAGHLNMCTH